jgi:uncharacterized iron-regulated membrane protein
VHRNHHLRAWDSVHRWTSLACTLFLMILCITGLPLIFHDEIDRLTQPQIRIDAMGPGEPAASLDRIIDMAVTEHPTMHPLYASHEPHEPRVWYVTLASSTGDDLAQVAVDARNAAVLGKPHIGEQGLMGFIHSLHVDLFAGLRGKLFLGFMGLLFLASLISGTVLYAPFMRKREFGAIRMGGSTRSRWLDLHNLLGIATLLWAGIVGLTGVMNTCSDLLLARWRSQVLADAGLQFSAAPKNPLSAQSALASALSHLGDRDVAFVAFPGSAFAGPALYGIYSRGNSPLTSRLVRPVLIDAHTGSLVSEKSMPWYLTLLLLSEPLHFGDYGGLPLKLIWAAFDVLTIVITTSGVYLWIARKRPARSGLATNWG